MANSSNFTINIKALFDASDIKAKVGDIQNAFKDIKIPDNLKRDLNNSFDSLNKALNDFETKAAKGIKSKADAKGLTGSMDTVIKEFTKISNLADKVKAELGDSVDLSKIIKLDDKTTQQLKNLQEEAKQLKKNIADINTNKLTSLQETLKKIKSEKTSSQGKKVIELFEEGEVEEALKLLDELIAKQEKLQHSAANKTGTITSNIENLKEIRRQIVEASEQAQTEVQKLEQNSQQQATVARQAFEGVVSSVNKGVNALHQYSNAASNAGPKIADLAINQAQFVHEVDQLKSRIQYFFGIANTINLVKRAVRDAVNTIKGLDKAMTATAVVTNFTVSDMWKQLPEYTKRANELGVTTQAAYEAATLYYQQGLNINEVNALSVETLKMARIAGLDAAEATDRMTNALRGFNMELTEANAQRVDDVYSELAANTASNVDEISTAMTKVASLAHSANMEFETTAAFLSQIIETTRESAETAGTALKTVVARFSEVKKLYSEDQLKGTDEEGQAIDVNKIGIALRTAGIDLNKYFLGEVGLDDIFMELASKWDSLTSVQQRYIATQAAGSRQQSRFIALMQDYARTQELVGKAYNANGASARQFEKTQESLESKLNRLKNAWNEFLMGLTNNVMVKAFVDGLTGLLNIVNKLTSAFGEGAGTILKWGVALGAIAGGKALFNSGGLLDSAIGIITQNTLLGAALGKKGIGGKFTGGDKVVAEQLGIKGGNVSRRASLFFGPGSLFKTLPSNIQKFKEANAIRVPWDEVARQIDLASPRGTGEGTTLAIPKTLFGALGNKFTGTKAGKGIQGALGKLPGIGSAFTGAAGGAATLAASLGAIALAGVAVWGMWKASPQGQLQTAQKKAKKAQEQAEKAKEELNSLISLQDTYKEKTEEVDKATNTQDRAIAIKERNEAILNAIKKDGTLAQYVITEQVDNEIVLKVDEAGLANAAKEATKIAEEAAINSYFKQANVGIKEANVAESKLRNMLTNTGLFDQYVVENMSVEDIYKNILDNTNQFSDKQLSKATELFNSYSSGIGVAEQQAKLAYGKQLSQLGVKSELTNALLPVLGEVFKTTGKEIDTKNLKSLAGMGKTQLTPLLEAWSGTGKMSTISLTDTNIDIDSDEFFSDIELSEQSLENFATYLGISTDEVKTHIKQQAKENKIIQQNNQAKVFEGTLKANIPIGQELYDTIKGFSPEYNALISDVITSAQNTMTEAGFKDLMEQMLGGTLDTDELKQIQDFYNNFNLDNPIQAFHNLKQAQAEVAKGSYFATVLNNIEQANQATFDTGNLVQTFLTSTSYDSLTESLEKFIEENGHITSKNIEELADSCKDLQNLIDDTTVTAQGLAEAFTALETGQTTIEGITTAALEALSVGQSFLSLIDTVQEWINNFKATDLTEGTQFIIDQTDKILEFADNKLFGNAEDYYSYLFGKDSWDKIVDLWSVDATQAAQKIQDTTSKLQFYSQDEGLELWRHLSKNGKLGVTDLGTGLDFNWDLENLGSSQDIINSLKTELIQLTGATDIADEAIISLITSAGAHMPDLKRDWDNLVLEERLTKFAESAKNARVVTEQELTTLAASVNMTSEELQAKADSLDIKIPIVVSWQDPDGRNLSGKELTDKFNEIASIGSKVVVRDSNGRTRNQASTTLDYSEFLDENDLISVFKDAAGKSFEGIDYSKLHKNLTEAYKLTPQQADEIATTISKATEGKNLVQEIQIPEINPESGAIESVTTVIEADSAEALQIGVETALEAAKADIIAQRLAESNYSDLTQTLTTAITTAGETGGAAAAEAVKSAIEGKEYKITVHAEVTGLPEGEAHGAVVGSYAKGSENFHVSPGTALTGEEGPELVWNKNKGYAYVTGEDGPEFANLRPGDRIFNAPETKRIFKNSRANGGLIDSYASGGWKAGSGSGGGGGGGSDKEDEEWKNEIDWLYNLVEDIAELERIQTELQETYDDYLIDEAKTGHDLYKLLIQQLGNLYTQLEHQNVTLAKREQEMREFMDTTNEFDEYLWYNWEDRTLEIDWDAIEALQGSEKETYDKIVDLISEAEDIQGKMDDAEDAIMDIQNEIQELEHIWRDTFTDFEERVYKAIVKEFQTVIDNYSQLNDTLNDSNQSILQAIQKEIALEREIRDNTKTEQEITDNEAQLAFLRRDTSGGNEVAALELQKQLAEQRENYQDSLVDQAISRLQEDNDAAAQQREHQIEIMQAQLDYQEQSGEFNAMVLELLQGAIGDNGELLTDSELMNLLKTQENWSAMSEVSQQVWEEELTTTFKEVVAFLLKQNAQESGVFTQALTSAIEAVNASIGSYSQGITKFLNEGSGSSGSGGGSGGSSSRRTSTTTPPPGTISAMELGTDGGNGRSSVNVNVSGMESRVINNGQAVAYYDKKNRKIYVTGNYPSLRYATGGLNTQTGPAWLDGTPSEPEYVLNARQTDAFLRLAEVLPDIMSNNSTTNTSNNSNITLNLSMNVDKIDSDYDVDRIADRVKDIIYNVGSYRNVNTLNFSR